MAAALDEARKEDPACSRPSSCYRRLIVAIPILLVVSALLFCHSAAPAGRSGRDVAAAHMRPLHEIEAKRHEMGLDLPLPQQYWIWLGAGAARRLRPLRSISAAMSASLVTSTLPATIELAALRHADRRDPRHRAAGSLLFHVRGTRAGGGRSTSARSCCCRSRSFSGVCSSFSCSALRCNCCHSPGASRPGCQRPTHHRVPAARRAAGRRPDVFWSALEHMILPAFALGIAFSPTDHARAALEPARRLSGGLHPAGASARPVRSAASCSATRSRTRPADADA